MREPDAPTVSSIHYRAEEHTYPVKAGVFSSRFPNVHIQGQPTHALLEEHRISIHNAGAGTRLVSSDNVLTIENLDQTETQRVWSVILYVDKITNLKHGAVTKHILMNLEDQSRFEQILHDGAVTTVNQLLQIVQADRDPISGTPSVLMPTRKLFDGLEDDIF